MRWLWLSDNPQLEDIRPIQKLTYIRQLLLDNTPIVDLAPLAELR
jgi:Leucine-rich repeat (LRR) protein